MRTVKEGCEFGDVTSAAGGGGKEGDADAVPLTWNDVFGGDDNSGTVESAEVSVAQAPSSDLEEEEEGEGEGRICRGPGRRS